MVRKFLVAAMYLLPVLPHTTAPAERMDNYRIAKRGTAER
jgi:hypothetical protein